MRWIGLGLFFCQSLLGSPPVAQAQETVFDSEGTFVGNVFDEVRQGIRAITVTSSRGALGSRITQTP